MNDGKQKNTKRVSFLEEDPCLTGVVRSREKRANLRKLESREMSAYESALILARLLTPDSEDAPAEPQRGSTGLISSFEMLSPAIHSAS